MATKKIKRVDVYKCPCNFPMPHPLRQSNSNGVNLGELHEYFPEEFFCDFCKGVITNNKDYILEVIKYHSWKRWGSIRTQRSSSSERDYQLEQGYRIYLDDYKKLLKLIDLSGNKFALDK